MSVWSGKDVLDAPGELRGHASWIEAVVRAAGLSERSDPLFRWDWLSRTEAEAIAAREMASRSINVSGWMRGAEFVANLRVEDFEYLRRIAGPAAADAAVRQHTFSAV